MNFDYTFHWRPVIRKLPELFEASLVTLQISVLSMIIGIAIGLVLALLRMSGPKYLSWIATIWVETARNTPALFQLFFFSFGIGAFGVHLTPYFIVLAGLAFNNAGYLAENFRGGFQAVPDTQLRAARSLGMSSAQAYTRIIIPQVFRIIYHPMTNQLVWAVLMSSLAMIVGFRELAGETQAQAFKTFRIFEYFAVAALIYYVMVKLILGISRLLAWRLFRY